MNNSPKDSFNSTFEKLQKNRLTLSELIESVPELQEQHLEDIVKVLIEKIDRGQEKYLEYLQTLLQYDRDEDRLTEVMEDIFSSLSRQSMNEDWFSSFWKEFLAWNTSDILVENFFIFLDEQHQKSPLTYKSEIIQQVKTVATPIVQFHLMTFLIQSHLHTYENTRILQLFYDVSQELQLAFIPTLLNLPKESQSFISKKILESNETKKNHLLILNILFTLKENLNLIFENYTEFLEFTKKLQDEKTYELLFNEFVKPESVAQNWIQELLLFYIKETNEITNIIIDASGEFISEWPDQFREQFLQLIMTGDVSLKESLAKIISPIWIDEQLINQLMETTDEKVREVLYESLITVYQLLTQDLQKKILKLFRTVENNQKYLGLLLASNLQLEAFKKEAKEYLRDFAKPQKEQLLGGLLVGLGMNWIELEKDWQTELQELAKKLPVKLKKELKKGLEMIYGLLDVEGMNFVTELQSYDMQIAPEDISFTERDP